MGELPAVVTKSNHFTTAVARTRDQPTVVEPGTCFQPFIALVIVLRGIMGSWLDRIVHLLDDTSLTCFEVSLTLQYTLFLTFLEMRKVIINYLEVIPLILLESSKRTYQLDNIQP